MAFPVQTLSQLRPILVGFRKSAGFTQAQLAARLGVTQQSYAQLEANPSAVSIERFFKVLNVLGVRLTLDPGTPDDVATPDVAPAPRRAAAVRGRKSGSAGSAASSDTPVRSPAAAKAPPAAARKRPAAATPGKPRNPRNPKREDW
ncbi:helix-turn-helix transcriptional regulator [Burkholderia ambifaria]|uniref:helix-turn-helix domain-containing protein n=1 Tax=Burkholderia ambifaria TaxID=152480 RepID=UPI00158F2B65|nr:helix-turn-helix transcriptional regulator [Burkholderia ambifaria]QQK00486.1 helix-turn-helix transcriptional regulator [Burkholderia ambifaria]